MSSLVFLVTSRKYTRASVTRLYNDRNNFAIYDDLKRRNLNLKLTGMQVELSKLNEQISIIKFDSDPQEDLVMGGVADL